MIVIGLTGSLASGKSAVAAVFKRLGARIFDADLVAKKLAYRGSTMNRSIRILFGKNFLKKNGELDRKKLARHVFASPQELVKLNTLMHPEVMLRAMEVIRRMKSRGVRVLVLDVPLLFESRMDGLANRTVVVKSPRIRMIERAGKKGIGKPLAKKILSNQWAAEKKERLADYVIENSGSLPELKRRAREVFHQIVSAYKEEVKGLMELTQGGKTRNGY